MKISYLDFVKTRLDPKDQLQKNFPASYDGKSGSLTLSNRKILFIEEKGLMRKTYNVALEIPYEKVGEITSDGRYKLLLTELEGKKHNFTFDMAIATTVMSVLKDLKESALSKVVAK